MSKASQELEVMQENKKTLEFARSVVRKDWRAEIKYHGRLENVPERRRQEFASREMRLNKMIASIAVKVQRMEDSFK